jgi:hypothetical protein
MRPDAQTALAAALFLGLAGCPPPKVDFGKDGEPKTVEELLKRVEMAELAVTAVKGDAKLKASVDEKGGSAGLFVAVVEPAFMHLEVLDFFGRPQSMLATDGVKFGLYDGQHGKFYRGPASAANMARAVPVHIPPKELAALLLGRVPRLAEPAGMTFDASKRVFVVTLGDRQRLEISPPSYRVVKSEVPGSYSVEMGDIEPLGGVTMPRHLALHAPGTDLELTYKDIELNVRPDPTLFDLSPPEDVPVVEVDATGAELR